VKTVDVDYLRSLIHYDPFIGEFRWKIARSPRCQRGGNAGSVAKNGKLYISIDADKFLAARLAWAIMTGSFPESEIDHKDGDKTNNRWDNLREATRPQNLWNRGWNSNNTSGYRGVRLRDGRWHAEIRVNNKVYRLGKFSTPEEASRAYQNAALRAHGEFYRQPVEV
jgi:hypothetical protein